MEAPNENYQGKKIKARIEAQIQDLAEEMPQTEMPLASWTRTARRNPWFVYNCFFMYPEFNGCVDKMQKK